MLGTPFGRVPCGAGGDLRPAAAARHSSQSHACDVEAAGGGEDARQLWQCCESCRGAESHQVVRKSPLFAMLMRRRDPIRRETGDGGSVGSFTMEPDPAGGVERTIPVGSLPEPSVMSALPTPLVRHTEVTGTRTLSAGACGKVDVDGPDESYMSVARNMSKGCPPSGS